MSYNKPENFPGDTRDFRRYVRDAFAEVVYEWDTFKKTCNLEDYTPLEHVDVQDFDEFVQYIKTALSRKNWGD